MIAWLATQALAAEPDVIWRRSSIVAESSAAAPLLGFGVGWAASAVHPSPPPAEKGPLAEGLHDTGSAVARVVVVASFTGAGLLATPAILSGSGLRARHALLAEGYDTSPLAGELGWVGFGLATASAVVGVIGARVDTTASENVAGVALLVGTTGLVVACAGGIGQWVANTHSHHGAPVPAIEFPILAISGGF